jgi:YggT family protein
MSPIGATLDLAFLVAELLLVARIVLDWVVLLGGAHLGIVGSAGQVTRTLTEPILAPVRRVIPPVRLGSLGIDLALPVLLLALQIMRPLVRML